MTLIQPYGLKTLWYDRRDTNQFHAIWTVIVFGIITLVLAILGILLAVAQVVGAFHP